MFIELNDKDAYCAHGNARDVGDVGDFGAKMDMHQLKVTPGWDMRFKGCSGYGSLKALKAGNIPLTKLAMLSRLAEQWLQTKTKRVMIRYGHTTASASSLLVSLCILCFR